MFKRIFSFIYFVAPMLANAMDSDLLISHSVMRHNPRALAQAAMISALPKIPLSQDKVLLQTFGRNLALVIDESAVEPVSGNGACAYRFKGLLTTPSAFVLASKASWHSVLQNLSMSSEEALALLQRWNVFTYNNSLLLFVPVAFDISDSGKQQSLGIDVTQFQPLDKTVLAADANAGLNKLSNFTKYAVSAIGAHNKSSDFIEAVKALCLTKGRDVLSRAYPWTLVIDGHGITMLNLTLICDLSAYHFKTLLAYLNSIATKAVIYGCCFAGSQNALVDTYRNNNRHSVYNFPILCLAFGNKITISAGADEKMASFFKEFNAVEVIPKNWISLRKNLTEVNRNYFSNSPQVRWAGKDSFELLLHSSSDFKEMINEITSKQVEIFCDYHGMSLFNFKAPDSLVYFLDTSIIKQRMRFEFDRLENVANISIESAIPGDQTHYIPELEIPEITVAKDLLACFTLMNTPLKFEMIGFSCEETAHDKKTYLIEKFKYAGDKEAKNIIVFNHPKTISYFKIRPEPKMYFELDDCSFMAYMPNPENLTFNTETKSMPGIKVKILVPAQAQRFKKLFNELKEQLHQANYCSYEESWAGSLATAHPYFHTALRSCALAAIFCGGYKGLRFIGNKLY